ncbi:MAG: IS4 family transposase, partial [Nitrosomonas sp.]|nr:IS4 family transposase [Nitrosomonas sp.]
QIWIAISVYLLVAIVKKRLNTETSLYTILQILSLILFEKTPIDQLVNNTKVQISMSKNNNHMNLLN